MRLALLAAATILSYAIAWFVAVPAVVPALNALAALPFLYISLKEGRTGRAVGEMLLWAAVLAVVPTLLSYVAPAASGRLFIHAEAYRREMFLWVQTGVGAESDPSRFVPSHLLHAALFSLLSLVSGSVLSMPMGAVLMNYMGHYVGALAAASRHPEATLLLAWVPWALIRVASFVTLGVVLAGPVMSRLGGFRYSLREHLPLVLLALSGLAADIALKALLAPRWQVLLKNVVGW